VDARTTQATVGTDSAMATVGKFTGPRTTEGKALAARDYKGGTRPMLRTLAGLLAENPAAKSSSRDTTPVMIFMSLNCVNVGRHLSL
jgi:hypothetical protein